MNQVPIGPQNQQILTFDLHAVNISAVAPDLVFLLQHL